MLFLIKKLRERIYKYRDSYLSDNENVNIDKFRSYATINLVITFSEMYYLLGRNIADEEIIFFKGGRFISDIIGSDREFEDIYDMYYELSNEIKNIFEK